jgi:hypothetical protein
MNEWIWFGLAAAVLFAVFGLAAWALGAAQKSDPMDRGQDSSSPGGYYTDLWN